MLPLQRNNDSLSLQQQASQKQQQLVQLHFHSPNSLRQLDQQHRSLPQQQNSVSNAKLNSTLPLKGTKKPNKPPLQYLHPTTPQQQNQNIYSTTLLDIKPLVSSQSTMNQLNNIIINVNNPITHLPNDYNDIHLRSTGGETTDTDNSISKPTFQDIFMSGKQVQLKDHYSQRQSSQSSQHQCSQQQQDNDFKVKRKSIPLSANKYYGRHRISISPSHNLPKLLPSNSLSGISKNIQLIPLIDQTDKRKTTQQLNSLKSQRQSSQDIRRLDINPIQNNSKNSKSILNYTTESIRQATPSSIPYDQASKYNNISNNFNIKSIQLQLESNLDNKQNTEFNNLATTDNNFYNNQLSQIQNHSHVSEQILEQDPDNQSQFQQYCQQECETQNKNKQIFQKDILNSKDKKQKMADKQPELFNPQNINNQSFFEPVVGYEFDVEQSLSGTWTGFSIQKYMKQNNKNNDNLINSNKSNKVSHDCSSPIKEEIISEEKESQKYVVVLNKIVDKSEINIDKETKKQAAKSQNEVDKQITHHRQSKCEEGNKKIESQKQRNSEITKEDKKNDNSKKLGYQIEKKSSVELKKPQQHKQFK